MAFENLGNQTSIKEAFQDEPLITAEKIKWLKANIDAECKRRNQTVSVKADNSGSGPSPGGNNISAYPENTTYKYINEPALNSLLKKEYKEKAALLMKTISGNNYQINGQIASQNDFIEMAVDATLYNGVGMNDYSPTYACTGTTCTGLCYSCTGSCTNACGSSCSNACAKGCAVCTGACDISCGVECNNACKGECGNGCGTACSTSCGTDCQRGCSECSTSCGSTCKKGCSECSNQCGNDCAKNCGNNCGDSCSVICNSCGGQCSVGCSGVCGTECSGGCGTSCTGGCSSTCVGGCKENCGIGCANLCTGCRGSCVTEAAQAAIT